MSQTMNPSLAPRKDALTSSSNVQLESAQNLTNATTANPPEEEEWTEVYDYDFDEPKDAPPVLDSEEALKANNELFNPLNPQQFETMLQDFRLQLGLYSNEHLVNLAVRRNHGALRIYYARHDHA